MPGNPFDITDDERAERPWSARLRWLSPARYGGALALLIVAAGVVAIGFGYFGAAGRGAEVGGVPDIRGQLPYLLSGGFLGLALVALGTGVMLMQAHRVDRARLEAKLDELAEVMRTASHTAVPSDARDMVVAGTSSYHSPRCRLVDGREGVTYLTAEEAAGQGLSACRVCHPPVPVGR